ncbi:hypothetical protein ACF1AJ_20565 [Leifsonia sp. NPDC014704]|uniref:hypothetical protein n=1 Tax=Leifsonia sp. NPDC014704 TaxID=3364123 RepID=UPI0036F46A90
MTDTPVWVSVADAAVLANRSSRTIYSWVEQGLLDTRTDDSGKTTVNGRQVLAVEPTVKRGRRPRSARPRTTY